MGNFRVTELTSVAKMMSRELSLAADRSLWAGEQDECIAIVAQIYSLFDDLNAGIPPDRRSCFVAADVTPIFHPAVTRDRRVLSPSPAMVATACDAASLSPAAYAAGVA